MSFKLQHLRGEKSDWAANDYVAKDGEIALYKESDGTYRMKIGNGTSKFSLLPSLTREVKPVSSTYGILMKHNLDVRCATTAAVSVNIPSKIPDDYMSSISFTAQEGFKLTINTSKKIYFSGDGLSTGVFVPVAAARYTLIFWYDTNLRCHIIEGKSS